MTLISIPANPVPDNVVTGTLRTSDGYGLRFARWAAPAGRKGTVCLLLGRAEFIEKYFETVRDLRDRGFAVVAFDWRGQGLSSRPLPDIRKGHVKSFGEYDVDLTTVVQEVVLPDCPPPIFALGHSMGAAMLIRAAYKGRRWFDRVVLSAPMIALPGLKSSSAASAALTALRLFGFGTNYVPGNDATLISMGPFIGNLLTSDPVRYARNAAVLEAEPVLGLGGPTVSWAAAAFKVMREFATVGYAEKIRQPLLIIAAGRDEVVSTPACEEFALHLRAGARLVVAGARHEILQEQDHYRAQFWAAFDAFIPGTPLYG
jgi:lysophospholipase